MTVGGHPFQDAFVEPAGVEPASGNGVRDASTCVSAVILSCPLRLRLFAEACCPALTRRGRPMSEHPSPACIGHPVCLRVVPVGFPRRGHAVLVFAPVQAARARLRISALAFIRAMRLMTVVASSSGTPHPVSHSHRNLFGPLGLSALGYGVGRNVCSSGLLMPTPSRPGATVLFVVLPVGLSKFFHSSVLKFSSRAGGVSSLSYTRACVLAALSGVFQSPLVCVDYLTIAYIRGLM